MNFFPTLMVKHLGRKVGQLLDQRFAPLGLTDTKAKILGALHRHQELTAKELLPWTEVEPGSLTEALQGLEREGLIQRKPHPKDGRAVLLSLTDAGGQILSQIGEALETAHTDLFAAFTEAEAEEFHRLCKVMLSRLDELGTNCRGKSAVGN